MLRDSQLYVIVVTGRKKKEIILPADLNDGQWRHVRLSCAKKRLTVRIELADGQLIDTNHMDMPKRFNVASTLFIGGIGDLPWDDILAERSMLENFKGCIRRFRVNNNTYDLAMPGHHNNVGQCFPRVEKGSFFPGDAYAAYGRKNEGENLFTKKLIDTIFYVLFRSKFPCWQIVRVAIWVSYVRIEWDSVERCRTNRLSGTVHWDAWRKGKERSEEEFSNKIKNIFFRL